MPACLSKSVLLTCVFISLGLTGCEKKREKEAKRLFDTAMRLEMGGNPKGQVMYVRIVMDYPETKAALEARKRADVTIDMLMEQAYKRPLSR